MRRIRVQVLYEYGEDPRPFSSSYIRLIRPLSYPLIAPFVEMVVTPVFLNQPTDIVIVDRLWSTQNLSLANAESLVRNIKKRGCKFVYSTDDDFSDSSFIKKDNGNIIMNVFRYFLENSDSVIVSTEVLKNNLSTKCIVIQNYLDERLILWNKPRAKREGQITIGYMGTPTHDQDLSLVLMPLIELQKFHPEVFVEFVGILSESTLECNPQLKKLNYGILTPSPDEVEYPLFMLWLMSVTNWDIGIAPLQDNKFNQNKSDIKLLDYTALGCSGIYSDVQPYKITTNGKGLVAKNSDEWFTGLTNLILDAEMRKYLFLNGLNYLKSERLLNTGHKEYLNFIECILS